ncbi:WD domain, G-beta repeat [Nesidiocoris tenuis]|nr:WD domain, G-beta repeat [Nesidiocoris tenuis]
MDDPLTKGPVPKWQKAKAADRSACSSNNSSANNSVNISKIKTKTPSKADLKKTPSKTPSKTSKSPGRKPKTPNGGDRFIPCRSATDLELGHLKIAVGDSDEENEEFKSTPTKQKEKAMTENLYGKDPSGLRILEFHKKAPAAPEGFQNSLKVVYSQSKTPSAKLNSRYIPQTPDRILDAPDIVDDYYLNLIDWNKNNILAVALRSSVYLWDAGSGSISQLTELEGSDYVCSVSWAGEGDILAIGTSLGNVQIWDAAACKKQRSMDGHSARVGSLSWNSHIVTSGCRSGLLVHHDVRQREHNIASVEGHSQEVCGLKWSPDGKYLASGGNDNLLNIWPSGRDLTVPLYTFSAHQAAVKALAWCPWNAGHLASGGGTADRHIRIWNCNRGLPTYSVDTRSQVCGIVWSSTYKELISGHGYANNQLIVWKYPMMTKVAELTGHSARVLHLALSPDGSTVLSAGADETLRLWNCFTPAAKVKKETKEVKTAETIFKGIR